MHKPSWQAFWPPLNKKLPIWTWKVPQTIWVAAYTPPLSGNAHIYGIQTPHFKISLNCSSLHSLNMFTLFLLRSLPPLHHNKSPLEIQIFSTSSSRPDTKYFPLHLPPPTVLLLQMYSKNLPPLSSSVYFLFLSPKMENCGRTLQRMSIFGIFGWRPGPGRIPFPDLTRNFVYVPAPSRPKNWKWLRSRYFKFHKNKTIWRIRELEMQLTNPTRNAL